MRFAIVVGGVAVVAMLVGVFAIGLDLVAGRVVAGLGLLLLWVPLSYSIDYVRERRRVDP